MQNRRTFLKQAGLLGAGLLLAGRANAAMAPVRIRGRVSCDDRGVAGVPVSDGLSVVATDADGMFSMVSDGRRGFVFISTPTGYVIPVGPDGTAMFYRPLPPGATEVTAEFRLQRSLLDQTRHTFLAIGDPQVQSPADVELMMSRSAPDLGATIDGLRDRDVFTVTLGDIVYDRPDLYPDYQRLMRRLGVPAFQVAGNHDVDKSALTDAVSLRTYQGVFGPRYYSFNRGEVHYVVLDDVFWFGGYIGHLGRQQLDWLAADLARVEAGRTVVVFMHIPPYCRVHTRRGEKAPSDMHVIINRELLYRLLEPYRALAVCGHMHGCEFLHDAGLEIHICGALCGAWWSGEICDDGAPAGYMIYDVQGGDLDHRYKSVGRPLEQQMRLYRSPSDELTANIWAATDLWQVRWYEDGQLRGPMKRQAGRDPLAIRLYGGPDKPTRHDWVEPELTDHLYLAQVSPEARRVSVEAIDARGRAYRQDLDL